MYFTLFSVPHIWYTLSFLSTIIILHETFQLYSCDSTFKIYNKLKLVSYKPLIIGQ